MIPSLLLISTGLLVYTNVLSAPFLFDDDATVLNNPSVRSLWPLGPALWAPLETGIAGRPLVNLSLALNFAISGDREWSYHLYNITVHLLASLCLFGIMRRSIAPHIDRADLSHDQATRLAFYSALLWQLHPLHTQAVSYVTQRCESQMGMFFLLTLYCAIRGWDGDRRTLWFGLATLAGLGAAGSKEVAVALLPMLLAYDVLIRGRRLGAALRQSPQLYLGQALVLLVLLALVRSGGTTDNEPTASAFDYLVTQGQVIVHYLTLSFWPAELSLDYDWPVATLATAWPHCLAVALLLGLTLWASYRRRPLGYLGLWFFVVLAPTSSLLPSPFFAFEYRMYLPLTALAVLVVLALHHSAQAGLRRFETDPARPRWARPATLLLVMTLALALGIRTSNRNQLYRSELAIWSDTVRQHPGSVLGQVNLAVALKQEGRLDEAMDHNQIALRLDPDNVFANNNLGNLWLLRRRPDLALPLFQRALSVDSDKHELAINVAVCLTALGRGREAVPILQTVLSYLPRWARVHHVLGRALQQAGDSEEAERHLQLARELNQ